MNDNHNNSFHKIPNKSLDIQEWLEYSLNSSNEIERLLALEDIEYQGLIEDYQDKIEQIANNDPSKECKELANKILKKLDIKKSLLSLEVILPNKIYNLSEKNFNLIAELVSSFIKKSLDPDLLNIWRQNLDVESNPYIVSIGISILSKCGNKEDLELVHKVSQKFFNNIHVCKASLDFYSNFATEKLLTEISKYLTHDELDVRIYAVRKLRLLDQPEAILYVKSLLYSKEPLLRLKALRELLLFDFTLSSDLYLQHLAMETIPYLIVVSGSAITFNPNPDFPAKIYDIILSTQNDIKKNILQSVINQLLYSIHASGILKEPIQDYLERLKQNLIERKNKAKVKIAIYNLQSDDSSLRLEAIKILSEYINSENIKKLLQKHYEKEEDSEIRAYLENLLNIKTQEQAQTNLENIQNIQIQQTQTSLSSTVTYDINEFINLVQTQKFYKLQPNEQNKLLNLIQSSQDLEKISNYINLLVERVTNKSVIINLLDKIYKFGLGLKGKLDGSNIIKLLNHSEAAVISQTIKTLAKLNIDQLMLFLPKLIQHEDIRVKRAVLEVYQVYDKNSALQHIKGMLLSNSQSIKKTAISLLATIDYTLVEPIIIEYINREKNKSLLQQAAYIIATNPSINGLYELQKIVFTNDGKLLEEFEEVWNSALEAAIPYLAPSKDELLGKIEEKAKQTEKPKEQKPALKEYQFNRVTAKANKNLFSEKDSQAIIQESVSVEPQINISLKFENISKINIQSIVNFLKTHKIAITVCVIIITIIVLYEMGFDSEKIITQIGLKQEQKKIAGLQLEHNAGKEIPSPISGAKKSISPLLSGKGYDIIMKKAEEERQRIRQEFEAENKKAFQNILHEMLNYPEYRTYAEFYMNENCVNAHKALEDNNISDAHQYFLKALLDPNLSADAKLFVCQGLMFTSFETGDFESLYKALDTFISTLPDSDVPKEYSREAIKQAFDEMAKAKNINPELFREKLQNLAQQNQVPLTHDEIEAFIESFKNFQKKYCK